MLTDLFPSVNLDKGIELQNFLQVCFVLFVLLEKQEQDFSDFCLNKNNAPIYKLLSLIIKSKGVIEQQEQLTLEHIKDLKCISFAMTSMFNPSDLVQRSINERVDQLASQRLSSLNNSSSNTDPPQRVSQLLHSNYNFFKPVFHLHSKLLRYENHLAIFRIH